jgi:hypothetical protein
MRLSSLLLSGVGVLCLGAFATPAVAATIKPELQFEYLSPENSAAPAFRIRRARIKIREDLGKRRSLYAKVKILPDKVALMDAYAELGWSHGISFRFGQFKRPFSRGAVTSSFDLGTTDRDIVYDLFGDNDLRLAGGKGANEYAGRDIGVAVRWRGKGLWARKANLMFAWSNGGSLGERDGQSPRHLSSRGWMQLCSTVDAGFSLSWIPDAATSDGWAFGADARWRWRVLGLWGEWLMGRNRVTGSRMIGSTVEGTLRVAGCCGGLRVSRVDPDIEILYNAEWALTPFVSYNLWDGAQLIAEMTRFDPVDNPAAPPAGAATQVVLALRVSP